MGLQMGGGHRRAAADGAKSQNVLSGAAARCQGKRWSDELRVASMSGPGRAPNTMFTSTISAACNTYWVDL